MSEGKLRTSVGLFFLRNFLFSAHMESSSVMTTLTVPRRPTSFCAFLMKVGREFLAGALLCAGAKALTLAEDDAGLKARSPTGAEAEALFLPGPDAALKRRSSTEDLLGRISSQFPWL